MASRRSRESRHDWASWLAPECSTYERLLTRAVGRRALVWCDGDHDELVVDVVGLNPRQLSIVADELSTLWPGFLAPAGVSLRVLEGQTWDHEAMALRSFGLRHEP